MIVAAPKQPQFASPRDQGCPDQLSRYHATSSSSGGPARAGDTVEKEVAVDDLVL